MDPAKKETINKLERVHSRVVRFSNGDYQCIISATSMLQHLQWKLTQACRETAQEAMHYRRVYNMVDVSADLLKLTMRIRSHTLSFTVPHSRTTVYKISFFPQAITIRLWNKLSGGGVKTNTLDSFKTQLSSHSCQLTYFF